MCDTTSVSKGVFVFKNGFNRTPGKKRKRNTVFKHNERKSELWYKSYYKQWKSIEHEIQKLSTKNFSGILSNLVDYVKNTHNEPAEFIPTATLLMGINMPDHNTQFETLSAMLKSDVTKHVVILDAENCQSIKTLMESMIYEFLNGGEESDSEDEDEESTVRVKKSQCTIRRLKAWYKGLPTGPSRSNLVVILPEFETFNEAAVQDFIEIAGLLVGTLPLVLVLGVSTSLAAVHRTMPYHVTSRLNIQVFNGESARNHLDTILEGVVLTERCHFHLGGRAFRLLCNTFLLYDLSVQRFLQNFKFSMLQHYGGGGVVAALCAPLPECRATLGRLGPNDLEDLRRLPSFRGHVEAADARTRVRLLQDNEFFRRDLEVQLELLHQHLFMFHNLLRLLHVLVRDLPRHPLGTQLRDLYVAAVSGHLTDSKGFQECVQLLRFTSKAELLAKLDEMLRMSGDMARNNDVQQLQDVVSALQRHRDLITNADFQLDEQQAAAKPELDMAADRAALRERLLELSRHDRQQNRFEQARDRFLDELTALLGAHLVHPASLPFHEIYFYDDAGALHSHVAGLNRASVHKALNDPQHYLRCECCGPHAGPLPRTLPDVSLAYKLHLECGRLINMYDWLQAFAAIVSPAPSEMDADEPVVDACTQARFTQAVAELEFLGFVKSSRRKTDHLARLTWGQG